MRNSSRGAERFFLAIVVRAPMKSHLTTSVEEPVDLRFMSELTCPAVLRAMARAPFDMSRSRYCFGGATLRLGRSTRGSAVLQRAVTCEPRRFGGVGLCSTNGACLRSTKKTK